MNSAAQLPGNSSRSSHRRELAAKDTRQELSRRVKQATSLLPGQKNLGPQTGPRENLGTVSQREDHPSLQEKTQFLRSRPGAENCSLLNCGSTALDGTAAQKSDLHLFQPSAPILLPGQRPALPLNIAEPTPIPGPLPDRYAYFVLQTRLRPWLAYLDPTLDLCFDTVPTPDRKGIQPVAYLMRGNYNVALEPTEGQVLTQAVEEILSGPFRHFCCLLHPACPPKVGIVTLPSYWIRSLLPFCKQMIDPELQPQIHQDGLCVRLNDQSDFVQQYRLLTQRLNEQLAFYFQKGTIVLSSLEKQLIEKWHLKVLDVDNSSQLLLVTTQWYDPLLTNFHPTHFLRTRLLGRKEIAFPLKRGKVIRHEVAVALLENQPSRSFWFSGEHLYTLVESYNEAVQIREICLQAESSAQGEILYLGQAPGVHSTSRSEKQKEATSLPVLWRSPDHAVSCVLYATREERIECSFLSILSARFLPGPVVEEILQQWIVV